MSNTNVAPVHSFDDLEVAQAKLVAGISKWTEETGEPEVVIPNLVIRRYQEPTERTCYIYEPSICVIAQGAKRTLLGDEVYEFDVRHFMLISVDLPATSQIIEASVEKPYLGLMLKFNPRDISELMVSCDIPSSHSQQASRALAISEISSPLTNAFNRLIDLLDEPRDIPNLAPLIEREILYRLFVGEQGIRLRQIATTGSKSQQIARAVKWLRDNFTQPLRVDELARHVSMSKSAFHHHFRTMTALSPLQYQKQLRLHEARKLMLIQNFDAADAAFHVGYESPSHFSRDYSRFFGAPPLRDIIELRETSAVDNA